MNIPNESIKLKDILTSLKIGLQESWGYYQAIICIGDWSRKGNQYRVEARFLDLVNEACIRCSILTLAGFISKNKNSVNFHYLLNIANESLNLFLSQDKLAIEKSIQRHKNWLEALISKGAIGNRIIDKRDKMIAHLDREFVTQKKPSFLDDNPPLNADEIEGIYKQLMSIINEIETFYYDHPTTNDLDLSVKDDIDSIFTLIENMPNDLYPSKKTGGLS